jgi:site-specific recombinase XerD
MSAWVPAEDFGARRTDAPTACVEDAIDRYLVERGWAGLSDHTLRAYRHDLRTFIPDRVPPAAWPDEIWLKTWRERMADLHLNTVRQRLIRFRAFWAWLAKHDWTPWPDPSAWLELPKSVSLDPRIPSRDELWRLLTSVDKTSWDGRRLLALLYLLIDTGLRISETLDLVWDDVNWSDKTIHVHCGKGAKSRTVPFGKMCFLMLGEWRRQTTHPGPEEPIFVTRTGKRLTEQSALLQLRVLSKKAGLSWAVYPHALRHYAATEMLRRGMNVETVRQILGHTSLKMVMRYLHMTGKDAKDAHRGASPADWLVRG